MSIVFHSGVLRGSIIANKVAKMHKMYKPTRMHHIANWFSHYFWS